MYKLKETLNFITLVMVWMLSQKLQTTTNFMKSVKMPEEIQKYTPVIVGIKAGIKTGIKERWNPQWH